MQRILFGIQNVRRKSACSLARFEKHAVTSEQQIDSAKTNEMATGYKGYCENFTTHIEKKNLC